MQSIQKIGLFFVLFSAAISAQNSVTLEKKTGYNGWTDEWGTVYAVKNGFVTIAVVPKLGGRVMQYDLGNNASLYIHNPQAMPDDGNDMVGGFRVLPSPQSDFGWPSPPNLDFNPYGCTEVVKNSDSVVLLLESQIENSSASKYQKHKGLQFKRLITVYKGSTRVKVEMTMLNKGTQTLTHGIWDITQTACPQGDDCWVYFQRNPSSRLGRGKGYVQYMHEGTDTTQWVPDAAEGNIMGVHFMRQVGKIGADCRAGWICFNNRSSGYAYVKTFAYQEGKTYPDSGASVQVYTYSTYDVLEVEVLGPLVELKPGDSTVLVENWYAARSTGPVVAVNSAGLVTKRLAAQQSGDSLSVAGTFGVFRPGKVILQFCDETGASVAVDDSINVTPTDSLRINKKFRVSSTSAQGIIRLVAYDAQGALIGTLDSATSPIPAVGVDKETLKPSLSGRNTWGRVISLSQGAIQIAIPAKGVYTIEIFSIDGKSLLYCTTKTPCRHSFNLPRAGQVLVARISSEGKTENRILSALE